MDKVQVSRNGVDAFKDTEMVLVCLQFPRNKWRLLERNCGDSNAENWHILYTGTKRSCVAFAEGRQGITGQTIRTPKADEKSEKS